MSDHTIAAAGNAPRGCEPEEGTREVHAPSQPAAARLTERQAVVLSAFTGKSLAPFYLVQRAAEEKLGRVLYTHQFADVLLWDELEEAFMDEVLAMLPEGFAP